MLESLTRESVRIDAPGAWLAAELTYAGEAVRRSILILNPHPHMGGSMHNHLVAHLAGALAGGGDATLRFDYRGVGDSGGPAVDVAASMAEFWRTGHAPEDPLMVDDARAILRWVRRHVSRRVVLIGYSFGSYVASSLLDPAVAGVAVISPTIRRHPFDALAGFPGPKLVIHSDDDFAHSSTQVEQWAGTLRGPVSVHCIPGAQHFYRGKEPQVEQVCRRWLGEIGPEGMPPVSEAR